MKIVHVCISSNIFGKNYAYQDNLLSKAHWKLGHEVCIIAPTYCEFDRETGSIISAPVGEDFLYNDIRLIRLKPVIPGNVNQHIHLFYGFGKTIKSLSPDLIFVHNISSPNYRFFKRYKKQFPNVKIVFDNHADFNNSCQNKLSYYFNRYFVRYFVVRKLKDVSDHFYGVTPARCEFLNEVYGVPKEKIFLLPMGADDEEIQLDKKDIIRREIRKKYGVGDDDFLIVTGGKIDPLKNIHLLAEAVHNSKIDNIKMLIFGSIRDDLKAIFDSLLSNRIQFIGWIPSNEVYCYFYAADIVMFPGLHSVLWEQAVASQTPCAFTRIKGFEHVDIGGNCILMEGKTADDYQMIVERIFSDKDLYQQLYNNAHTIKSQQFLYSHIAQKVLDDIQ